MERPTTIAQAIQKPLEWPRWPFLPVVHRQTRRVGLVFENGTSKSFRFLEGANMFDPANQLENAKEFDAAEMDAEGWEVD